MTTYVCDVAGHNIQSEETICPLAVHITAYFRDETFQTVNCSDTDSMVHVASDQFEMEWYLVIIMYLI